FHVTGVQTCALPISLEILAKPETPPGFITCTTPAPSPGPLGLTLTGWKGIAKRVADRAVTLFLPPLLHAGSAVRPGGLGGLTSNFSPFGDRKSTRLNS